MAQSTWHLLVGHYLGIDHAGHTFGVNSPQMLAKVQQTDREFVHVRPRCPACSRSVPALGAVCCKPPHHHEACVCRWQMT